MIRKPAKVSQGGGEAQHSGKVPPPGVSPATTVAGPLVGVLLSIVLVAMGPSAQQPHSYYAPRGLVRGGHLGATLATPRAQMLRHFSVMAGESFLFGFPRWSLPRLACDLHSRGPLKGPSTGCCEICCPAPALWPPRRHPTFSPGTDWGEARGTCREERGGTPAPHLGSCVDTPWEGQLARLRQPGTNVPGDCTPSSSGFSLPAVASGFSSSA